MIWQWTAWGSTVLLATAATIVSSWRGLPPVWRATPPLVVVAVLMLVTVFGVRPPAPSPVLATSAGLAVVTLGVVGGSSVTSFVLGLTVRPSSVPGQNGGIVVDSPEPQGGDTDQQDATGGRTVSTAGSSTEQEVMRGGAAIGHLERAAIVGAALVGRFEIIAAVIAIKGLGRFTELDTAEARERFIVGTLASSLWAGCAAAVVLMS
ncbi:hypothetical protein DEJ34_07655 [Curtobacterium sp. MCPF17_050]|uniref:hypothetical protein n=1 Tax=Curtobacterium sp. MCPF17_050 TaxID=2175664 RepID=UPI000D82168D|nr:hypothetical protein [Curtobacterium sp. MCPF17_050]WIB16991.1 hypothetical protein DEJ34_07655 [Curtobacterium sp. MCPF17_050]